mgnify:CR=1 FL=1
MSSKEDGLFSKASSRTLVFKLKSPDLSVLTPKLDKYTLDEPNPDSADVVKESIWSFKLLITGSSASSPLSVELSPLNFLAFKTSDTEPKYKIP